MARYKGNFKASANYEPQIAAPFDARALVEARADLFLASTWQQKNGDIWTYPGMIVSVASDINPSNNGVYMLLAQDFTQESNWQKLSTLDQIMDLQKQIDELQVEAGSIDIELDSEDDLPAEGDENATYYIKENNSIQRWDESTQEYISYGGGSADFDINIINGGNSNG